MKRAPSKQAAVPADFTAPPVVNANERRADTG